MRQPLGQTQAPSTIQVVRPRVLPLVLLLTGMAAANIMGQRIVRWWEGLLSRIPIVRSIYSSVKQVSDTLLAPDGHSFRRAVMVEFPQRGQWAVAFVVGSPSERVARELGEGLLVVYVPTAPNPTSGYTLVVKPEEVRDLDMSVDEALKFVISLGVVGAHTPKAIESGYADSGQKLGQQR